MLCILCTYSPECICICCVCVCIRVTQLLLEKEQQDKLSDENIRRAQQKADMKIMLLTKKLKAVTDDLEKTQTQLSSVLSDSNTDQTALLGITNKIEV